LLAWFEEEEDNLRATLDYLERAAPPDAARAATLLTPFSLPRGRHVEGRERLLRLLAGHDFAAGIRAVLLENLADHELRLGKLDSAESHAHDAVKLAQESGERRIGSLALHSLAQVAGYRGDFDEAIRVLARVVEEAADDEWQRSVALGDLANFQIETGRDEEARHMLQEANRGLHATADEANQATTMISLAYLELYVRDFEAAYVAAASVLEKVRAIGDDYRGIGARNVLGFAALGLGRRGEAREAFAESLDLVLAADSAVAGALTETLAGIALAADRADVRPAAQLQGAVDKLDEAVPRAHDSLSSSETSSSRSSTPSARTNTRTSRHSAPAWIPTRRSTWRERSPTRRAKEWSPSPEGPRRFRVWEHWPTRRSSSGT
jgi:predicted negative regulator of RcsB-dependent stress response